MSYQLDTRESEYDIVVVGGGTAGPMAAIKAKERNPELRETVLLVLDPYDYFSMLVSGTNNKLDITGFREEIKYLKVNRGPLERMLQKLEEKNLKEVSGNEAFAILDQILEELSFTPDDVDGYVEKFTAVEKFDPEKFYVKKGATAPAVKATPVNTPKAVKTKPSPQPAKVNTVNST